MPTFVPMRDPKAVLKAHWGYDEFRPMQADIVQSVLDGQDTLALLPTGGGKSICFQVPAMCLDGMAIVISPLIALMKDQVERLNQLGIPATYINSAMSKSQVDLKLQGAMDGLYKFLYLAPERIQSDMFKMRLPQMQVSRLIVDEAHCISQWGYDFRPAYRQIAEIREVFPDLPIAAFTATATKFVQEDTIEQLGMRQPKVFRGKFRRDNVRFFVLDDEQVIVRTLEIIQRTEGSGIVYVRTRKLAERIRDVLRREQISAGAYHGGMLNSERAHIQQEWVENRLRIMVATNAFGMGIDKPDVRFVIHYNLPLDLESYYQEAGRGGRDGEQAMAIAFNNPIDLAQMKEWQAQKYPSWDAVQKVYRGLMDRYRVPFDQIPFNWHEVEFGAMSAQWEVSVRDVFAVLRILHLEGFIHFQEDREDKASLFMKAGPSELVLFRRQNPAMHELVEFILRTAGGVVYAQEVKFSPGLWANKLRISAEKLDAGMRRLEQFGILSYEPATSKPSLKFLKPQIRLTQSSLNWPLYQFLKQEGDKRLAKIEDYMTQRKTCRAQILETYFGAKDGEPCGVCDVCMNRRKGKLTQTDEKLIRKEIWEKLGEETWDFGRFIHLVTQGTTEQRESILRDMVDKKWIKVDGRGRILRGK
ncbi:ATP-dependent DNA helicase RecQ [Pontibacter sp. G13]|uniref:RecQ family ATP-dependent DNA helicase n=1 Tax=Pontibacter sp. G13 TaxID=3074898 RepID=UPI00288B7C30|nr:ATP-dependent DNA helicase RecQ [Pontibacter sp. G13]WNJ17716.1 ATP-dependent DNA helicase RecQ [Pontibacter sp. G13]